MILRDISKPEFSNRQRRRFDRMQAHIFTLNKFFAESLPLAELLAGLQDVTQPEFSFQSETFMLHDEVVQKPFEPQYPPKLFKRVWFFMDHPNQEPVLLRPVARWGGQPPAKPLRVQGIHHEATIAFSVDKYYHFVTSDHVDVRTKDVYEAADAFKEWIVTLPDTLRRNHPGIYAATLEPKCQALEAFLLNMSTQSTLKSPSIVPLRMSLSPE